MRVLFYAGCLINRFYPEMGYASVDVLRRNGIEVITRKEKCCGIPAFASGDMKGTRKVARWNIESFSQEPLDAIVTSCPTCSMVFKEYAWLFREERGGLHQKAAAVSEKVHDFTDFLVNYLSFAPPGGSVPKRVTYHDPCHLRHSQGITEEPRILINSINGIEFVEMEKPDICCGFGGFFSLVDHHDLSCRINDRLIEQILNTGAEVVVDACPPCILQLREGFYRHRITRVEIKHIAELLDEAYKEG